MENQDEMHSDADKQAQGAEEIKALAEEVIETKLDPSRTQGFEENHITKSPSVYPNEEKRNEAVNAVNNVENEEENAPEPEHNSGSGKRRGSMFEEIKTVGKVSTPKQGKPSLSAVSWAPGLQAGLEKLFRHDLSTDHDSSHKKPIRRPKLIYENTFQLEPKKIFDCWEVKAIITKVLQEHCKDMKYSSKTCTDKAADLAEKIRAQVLPLQYERYKIICYVIIRQQGRQGMFTGFRGLWDSLRDSYATDTFENHYVNVTGVVYGIYYD